MLERLQAAYEVACLGKGGSGFDRPRGMFVYHTLPKAGHWLHTDNPAGLTQLLLEHLTSQPETRS